MSIFTKAFWLAAGERAIKSAAQGAILVIAADQINAFHVAWGDVGGFALGAAALSVLTSVGSDLATSGSGPSLTNAETLDVPVEQFGLLKCAAHDRIACAICHGP